MLEMLSGVAAPARSVVAGADEQKRNIQAFNFFFFLNNLECILDFCTVPSDSGRKAVSKINPLASLL